ncbi:MAG: phenylalanine--tRNA ligase subunit beta [Candidatus Woesearchaeota archaeon]
MPTITLNKNVFEKLVGKKLPIDKLKDRISMLGTDLEKIEGNEIHVEIFPNRPDMLSEQGFARAFSSFIGVNTGLRKYNVKKSRHKVIVKNLPKEWPYAVACIVRGLKLDDEKVREIIQLQEKLGMTFTRNRKKGGLGLYPCEKLTFPVKFIGMKPEDINFRPLEFPNTMPVKQILAKHPKGKEYGYIMEGWDKYPVFVDDKNIIMSMPPIINSHDVGKIDENTTDVFIEGTGPDLNTIKTSLFILTTSLADMGGKIESLDIVYPDRKFTFPDLSPKKIKLKIDYVNKILGVKLKDKELKKYLEQMGYGIEKFEKGKETKAIVLVPAYRADILHPIDLVEDIAIAYGYENFKEEIPNVSTIAEEDEFEVFKKNVANIMVGLGIIEVCTYHLINEKDQTTNMCLNTEVVKLANATTEEFNSLRLWMIPCLMNVLKHNKHNEYPQNIFDIGVVFKKNIEKETNVEEFTRIACALSYPDADYTGIRQRLDNLLKMLDVEYKVIEYEHDSFIPGRVGRVVVDGKKIAVLGEISPVVLKNFELNMPTGVFELNLTELFNIKNRNK